MIQLQQAPIEFLLYSGGQSPSFAEALCWMEAQGDVEVVPSVGGRDGTIEVLLGSSEVDDVAITATGVVHFVVEPGYTAATRRRHLAAELLESCSLLSEGG